MRIIFIRHAEPDYENNTLTCKGFREADILANRIKNWDVTEFYSSPLRRAQLTAEPSMEALGRSFIVKDWLQEFHAPIDNPAKPGKKMIPWDFPPVYLDKHPELFDVKKWVDSPLLKSGDVAKRYDEVCTDFDNFLASYGYQRNGLYYRSPADRIATNHFMKYDDTTVASLKTCQADETTIVCFCHLGITLALMSHLLNTTPVMMWQSFFVPPASVTILNSEERTPGEAYFRCQTIGDTAHLREAGEPVSYYGSFANPFQM